MKPNRKPSGPYLLDAKVRHRADFTAQIVPGFVILGFVVLFLRLWYLQVVKGEELSRLAIRSRTIEEAIPPPRGQIVDRENRPLATVEPALAVMITPHEIIQKPDAISHLAKIIQEDPKELQNAIRNHMHRRFLPFVEKVGLRENQAIAIEEQRAFLPGVFVRSLPVRKYHHGKALAHVIGYVGGLDEKDIERILAISKMLPPFTGKIGIERAYDDKLMGTPGIEAVEVDSRGKPLRPRTSEPPIPGSKLVLTLDLDLQEFAASVLQNKRGAIVALNPKNGEILCLYSNASYDPNLFVKGITAAQWEQLSKDPRLPLHNRAIASAYAPGSTFKLVTLIAGIKTGVITPSTTFVCRGGLKVGNRYFRCLGVHGSVNFERAIEKSCNVFFAEIATRVQRHDIVEVAKEFGFGTKLGIDILGESTGTLPSSAWLEKNGIRWYLGDSVNLSIGQGYLGGTPLQLANYASTIANKGIAYKPHLVRSIVPSTPDQPPQEIEPVVFSKLNIDSLWWDRITNAMVRVVDTGTGRAAHIEGVRFAGKTGTAQQKRGATPHALFIGFAPADDPEIAIAVVLEGAGQGGQVAAPIAGKVVRFYLQKIGAL
ncbi:MAG TPA: penicillin-binding protein 2 [Fimbriimonadales bacterium]|nr:penicillin-binding protein 2 [Fimbriimonadales bacterium]